MALSQNLIQKQTQKLIITQDLRQSIELLPLSNIELSEKIQSELIENPLLEESSESESFEVPEVIPEDKKEKNTEENRETEEGWNRSGSEDSEPGAQSAERTERKHQFIQNAVSNPESLADHLLWQLRLSELRGAAVRAGEIIISAIDSRGFLTEPLENLFQGTEIPMKIVRAALKQIQNFDPVGCGAGSIPESLLIQARFHNPMDTVTQDVLSHYFEDIERLDYKKIEKNTGYTQQQLEQSLNFIRTLEPYPGTLHSSRQPEYIIPDLAVIELEGRQEVIINDDWMPGLRVNESYKNLIKDKTAAPEQDREYLQSKLNSAVWLIKSIKQRRQTLYRVMKSIVEFEEEFFRSGHGFLKPLTLREVAEKVELHESTISRITTNKFVQTRWGVFELKFFFTSSLKSSSGGAGHSAKNIQDKIKQLIDREDSENPLSDQGIVDLIGKEGVQIARRTVAKYRKNLKILPADRRKKIKKLKHHKS